MTDSSRISPNSDFLAISVGERRPQMRIVTSFFLTALSTLFGIVSLNVTDINNSIIYGSLALAILLLACFLVVTSGNSWNTLFDLRLGSWFFGYAVVAYGISTITILDPSWVSAQVSLSWIPGTLLLLAAAFLLATFGYKTRSLSDLVGTPVRAFGRLLASKRGLTPRSSLALYSVFALGVLADVASAVLSGQYGYLGSAEIVTSDTTTWFAQPMDIISKAKFAAISGLTIVALRSEKRSALLLLAPVVLLATLLGILTGMKESFVDVILAILIPWILVRKRIPVIGTVVAGLIFVLLITPFITQLRGDVRGSNVLNVQEGGEYAISQLFSLNTYLADTNSEDSALQVASRIRLVDNLALIRTKTPSVFPYRNSLELVAAPLTGMIPRAVWPDKPVRLAGYDFYKTYYEGQGESSSAITPQGSLFMFGGVPMLLTGMFLIGVALRALDDSLNSIGNAHSVILLVLISPIIVKQEMDVPGFLASVPIMIVTWAISVFLVFGPIENKRLNK